MKILLVGSFRYAIYAPAFEAGFKKLGHEVISIKSDEYNYGEGKLQQFLNRLQVRFHIGFPLIRYNKDIERKAIEIQPDFIFFYSCVSVWGKTVRRLKQKGFFIFTYHNDDPFSGVPDKYYYRYFLKNIKFANINFVYRTKNVNDYERLGLKNAKVLLPYYIGDNNFHIDCEKDIPIAFIGHYEEDGRDKMILALKEAGLPVRIYSGNKYWKKSTVYKELEDIIFPGVCGIEYNSLLNRIKVALVFLSKLNSDTYTRRCFEIPATSTLMLCEYTDDMNNLYPENTCAFYFKNQDELIEKCKYLLANPSIVQEVAINGFNRLKEIGGSEVDRCHQIIHVYEDVKV